MIEKRVVTGRGVVLIRLNSTAEYSVRASSMCESRIILGVVQSEENIGRLEEWSEGGKIMSVLPPRWLLIVDQGCTTEPHHGG